MFDNLIKLNNLNKLKLSILTDEIRNEQLRPEQAADRGEDGRSGIVGAALLQHHRPQRRPQIPWLGRPLRLRRRLRSSRKDFSAAQRRKGEAHLRIRSLSQRRGRPGALRRDERLLRLLIYTIMFKLLLFNIH